jgi:hypothetical protein
VNNAETLGGDGSCVRRRNPHPSKGIHQFVRVQGEAGCNIQHDCIVGQRQVIVEHHLYPQTKVLSAPYNSERQKCMPRTFPHNRRLAKFLERAMRRLRKHIERLLKRPPIQITLRLRIICVTLHIDLIPTGAKQRRGEHLRDRAQ